MIKLVAISQPSFTSVNREIFRRLNNNGYNVTVIIPETIKYSSGIKKAQKIESNDPDIIFVKTKRSNPRLQKIIGLTKILNDIKPNIVLQLLTKGEDETDNDYEKLFLVYSYFRNGYCKKAEEIFYLTLEDIVNRRKSGDLEYQTVKKLILSLDEWHFYSSCSDDFFHLWMILLNKVYGVFYNDNN